MIYLGIAMSSFSQTWVNFNPANTGSNTIQNNNIVDVIEDANQNLWISDAGGISKFNGNSWTAYSPNDGLIDKYAYVLFNDISNNIWFGTYSGLSVYDGNNFTNYTSNDGLVYNIVKAIGQDNNETMWFGTQMANDGTGGGLSKFDGSNWESFTSETSPLPHNDVRAICTNANNIWIGTRNGLAMFDGISNWVTFTSIDGLANDTIQSLFKDQNNHIWIGTPSGVSFYDGSEFTNYNITNGLLDNSVIDIYEDNSQVMWFSTPIGASSFDGSTWTSYSTLNGEDIGIVRSIIQDNLDNMWFATRFGLLKKEGIDFTTYSTFDGGIVDNNTWSITVADNNDIWLTGFNGITKYDGSEYLGYSTKDGLAENYSWTAVKDLDGNIWFPGASLNKVTKFDGNNFTIYDLPDAYGECSYVDKDGNIWFGSYEGAGAIKFDGNTWTVYNDPLIEGGIVLSIVDDLDGNMYFGAYNGVIKFDGTSYSEFVLPASKSSINSEAQRITQEIQKAKGRIGNKTNKSRSAEVSTLFRDSHGNIWFTITDGFYVKWDGTNFTSYPIQHNFFYCTDITEDYQGNIWFAQYESTIDKFDGNNWTTYNSSNSLIENAKIFSIASDQNNGIWVGYQNNGVSYSGVNADFNFEIFDCSTPVQFFDLSYSTNADIVSWEWHFDDPDSGADSVSTSQNPNHTFVTNKTSFNVKLAVTDALGMRDAISKWITPYTPSIVQGTVTSDGGQTINKGYVKAFLLSNGILSNQVDSVQIQSDGSFMFENMSSCVDYIFRAYADEIQYPTMVPRWYIDAFYWFDAVPVSIAYGDELIQNVDIKVFELVPPPSGSSSVGGGVYYYGSKGQPVKNVDVVLEYEAPDEKGDVIVGFEPTDELGRWSFGELGDGVFKIKVDIPGLSMDSVYTVQISEANTNITGLNYYLDPEKGIFTDYTGISEYHSSDFGTICIYPNPVQETLNLEINRGENKPKLEISNIEIRDMQGRVVREFQVNYKGDEFSAHYQIDDLQNGFYFIKINNDHASEIQKIIIQK